jgi:hypothetical protein
VFAAATAGIVPPPAPLTQVMKTTYSIVVPVRVQLTLTLTPVPFEQAIENEEVLPLSRCYVIG